MKRNRTLSVVFAAMFPVIVLGLAQGCGSKKGDDDVPPTASVAPPPPPAPTPSAPATVMPEEPDAGADAGDAGADAGKPTGGGSGGAYTSISKCCAALAQNAQSAPPDQKVGYMTAAQACQGLKNTPAANQAFAQLRMFLAGAKMPGACH
jgi:hypothetical protein